MNHSMCGMLCLVLFILTTKDWHHTGVNFTHSYVILFVMVYAQCYQLQIYWDFWNFCWHVICPQGQFQITSVIKSYVTLYQLPNEWLSNVLISNYLRAIHIQVPHVSKPRSVLSLTDIGNISVVLQKFDNPLVYRCAFLLSFYGPLELQPLS